MQDTHPNIPAAKYVNKNPPDPISRSIYNSDRINGPFDCFTQVLYLCRKCDLSQHVKDEMDDASM